MLGLNRDLGTKFRSVHVPTCDRMTRKNPWILLANSGFTKVTSTALWQESCKHKMWWRVVVFARVNHKPQICASIPVASLSAPASYIQSHRWLCSQVWLHTCSPDRRLRWYSHWSGSHSDQHQLDNKQREFDTVSDCLCDFPVLLCRLRLLTHTHKKTLKAKQRSTLPTFGFNHVVVPNFQGLWYC